MARRPRLAVWKFASCDGCQLVLLDCEDELLQVADAMDIAYFKEATPAPVRGNYDMSLVDGSISTPADLERIQAVRKVSKRLVAIGACAVAGGIQSLRNFEDAVAMTASVYPKPAMVKLLPSSTAISAHVPVELELPGCPIDKRALLETLSAFIAGRRPEIPGYSVCLECKSQANVCVMVAHGTPCLGPVTKAGCGALCPGYERGCYGCFGPMETPNTASLVRAFHAAGWTGTDVTRAFRSFNADAPEFRRAARDPDGDEDHQD